MTEERIVAFFRALAVPEPEQRKKLSIMDSVGVACEGGECRFSIDWLYRVLGFEGSESYREFRAVLFKSRVNEALFDSGYRIDIHHSTGSVDTSIYKLVLL